jgi:hypothetical protein
VDIKLGGLGVFAVQIRVFSVDSCYDSKQVGSRVKLGETAQVVRYAVFALLRGIVIDGNDGHFTGAQDALGLDVERLARGGVAEFGGLIN